MFRYNSDKNKVTETGKDEDPVMEFENIKATIRQFKPLIHKFVNGKMYRLAHNDIQILRNIVKMNDAMNEVLMTNWKY